MYFKVSYIVYVIRTLDGGRIGRPRALRAGDRKFSSWLSQTMAYQIGTCRFLAWHSALIGKGKNWLTLCQDSVTEWDIKSQCQ